MSIVRVAKRKNPFVQIDKTVFEDESISWQAKGLMGYLLSRPANWEIRMADLQNRATNGRLAVRNALAELEAAGYVERSVRRKNGKLAGWDFTVFEVPVRQESVRQDPRLTKNLPDRKPAPNNKECTNNDGKEEGREKEGGLHPPLPPAPDSPFPAKEEKPGWATKRIEELNRRGRPRREKKGIASEDV